MTTLLSFFSTVPCLVTSPSAECSHSHSTLLCRPSIVFWVFLGDVNHLHCPPRLSVPNFLHFPWKRVRSTVVSSEPPVSQCYINNLLTWIKAYIQRTDTCRWPDSVDVLDAHSTDAVFTRWADKAVRMRKVGRILCDARDHNNSCWTSVVYLRHHHRQPDTEWFSLVFIIGPTSVRRYNKITTRSFEFSRWRISLRHYWRHKVSIYYPWWVLKQNIVLNISLFRHELPEKEKCGQTDRQTDRPQTDRHV